MQLVQLEISGKDASLWRLVRPAAVLHAVANLRGKKPIFKWSSSAPWVEMQVQAWSTMDEVSPLQAVVNGLVSLLWLSCLIRVLISLCRQYYSLSKEQHQLLAIENAGRTNQASAPSENWSSNSGDWQSHEQIEDDVKRVSQESSVALMN